MAKAGNRKVVFTVRVLPQLTPPSSGDRQQTRQAIFCASEPFPNLLQAPCFSAVLIGGNFHHLHKRAMRTVIPMLHQSLEIRNQYSIVVVLVEFLNQSTER
jgi:hypothetical protein